MRIALLSMHYAEYSYRLASSLAASHDVLLIVTKRNYENELGSYKFRGVPKRLELLILEDCRLRDPQVFYNTFLIIRAVHEFDPDVVHLQEGLKDYLVWSLMFLAKYPRVLTIHDPRPHSGQDAKLTPRRRFYRSYLRSIPEAVIVHGTKLSEETRRIIPKLADSVFSIPHGPLGAGILKEDLEIKTRENGSLLFFGRIEEYKGLGYFLSAMKLLREWGVNVRATIAGAGNDLERYRNEIVKDDRILLIDRYISPGEIPGIFKRSNIVVLPYADATQSGIAAMALTYGKPIIASDVGSVEEMVTHGVNGYLVPPRDPKALAQAIRQLLSNDAKMLEFARNSLKRAQNELSWPVIAQATTRVYLLAIQKKQRRFF